MFSERSEESGAELRQLVRALVRCKRGDAYNLALDYTSICNLDNSLHCPRCLEAYVRDLHRRSAASSTGHVARVCVHMYISTRGVCVCVCVEAGRGTGSSQYRVAIGSIRSQHTAPPRQLQSAKCIRTGSCRVGQRRGEARGELSARRANSDRTGSGR
jgi:hypothetical protein